MTAEALAAIALAESALCCECPSEARAALASVADPGALAGDLFARYVVADVAVRLLPGAAGDEPEAVDRVALSLRRALARASTPRARALIGRQLARCFAQKRCPSLALAAAEAAVAADAGSTAGPDALAFVHLQFDRRDEARAVLEAALGLDEPWRAHLGLARVAYVTGDFAGLERALDATEELPFTRVPILRWRSIAARVRTDWATHLHTLDAILAATPGGYRQRGDQTERARTLHKLDRVDEAREAYRAVWLVDNDDACGQFAREVLNTLERSEATSSVAVSLGPFPSVTQKRNYCGPASLELVLRYLGVVGGDQDTIASEVKLPAGSPMVRLTQYLASRGLEVRRFEATPERLRACLGAGLPVILQEEYSTTTHVAVCTGIDERIGLLTVQDPMTHAPSERLVATQARLGALFRNGALVACPTDANAKLAALDAASVFDAVHIRLLDSCDEGRDGEGAGGPSPDEKIRRCREALRLCDDYLLARLRLCDELLELARAYASKNNIDRFLLELRKLRVQYGGEERPHQIHARYLYWQDRVEEALIEYEDALRLDPGDSNNAQAVAECHQLAGRADDATKAFWNALTVDPEHVRATENFASHALDQGDAVLAAHLSECALDMAPGNPFNRVTAARIAREAGDSARAIEHARKAVEIDPQHTYAARQLGEMLCADPATRAEGVEVFGQLVKRFRGWFEPRLACARWTAQLGDVDGAVALLREGIDAAEDDPNELLAALQEILADHGRVDDAVAQGEAIVRKRDSLAMREKHLALLIAEDRDEAALALARKLIEDGPDGVTRMCSLGNMLAERGDPEGEKLLRRTIELAPTYHYARGRLARLLMPTRPAEALDVLDAESVEQSQDLLALRAEAALELGQLNVARRAMDKCLARGDVPHFAAHLTYAELEFERAGGTPDELFERLEHEDRGDPPALRLRLALAVALGHDARAMALAERLPEDSWSTHAVLIAACENDDAYRELLESRLRGALEKAARRAEEPSRWTLGVLAGSRAARGDEASLDALARDAHRVWHVAAAARSLHDGRHRALIDAVRERAAAKEPASCAAAEERGALLFWRDDRAASRSHLDASAVRWPRSRGVLESLSAELLLALEPVAHDVIGRRLALGNLWAIPCAIASASAWLRADRDGATRWITRAERHAWASGWRLHDHPLITGVAGAIRGDAAAVDRARRSRGASLYPGARLWDEMVRASAR